MGVALAVTSSVWHSALLSSCTWSQGQQLQLAPGQADSLQRQAASWDVPQHVVANLHSQLHGSFNPSTLSQLQGLSLCSSSGACYRRVPSLPPLHLLHATCLRGTDCLLAIELGSFLPRTAVSCSWWAQLGLQGTC